MNPLNSPAMVHYPRSWPDGSSPETPKLPRHGCGYGDC